jgi:hypothetical protein
MLFNVGDASTARCRGTLQTLLWHFRGIFTGILVTNFDSVNLPLVESQVSLSRSQKYKTKMEVDRRDRGNELHCSSLYLSCKKFYRPGTIFTTL